MKIRINHIEKTEGHFDFEGALLRGDMATAKILTTEGVRLIEAIMTGRKFYQAPVISARICGICPVVHSLNCIKAIEDAFGFLASAQTIRLRKLMELAQIIHSHGLHLYFLSAPDFYGVADDLKFIKKYPKEAQAAVASRNFALKILEVISGRAVHPIACEVGGFKVLPSKKVLQELLNEDWPKAMEAARKLVDFAKKLRYPEFERKTNFMALSSLKEYAYYDGKVRTSTGRKIPARKFSRIIEELQLPGLGAKRANYRGTSFMVGALARLNLNNAKLNPEAKSVVKKLKLKFPIYNTFYNILAQAIEILHFTEEAGKLLLDLSKTLKREKSLADKLKLIAFANPKNRTTIGFSVMEAPRGILYDMIEVNRDGIVTQANIITPTVMFLNNLEEDLKVYIPDIKKLANKQRELKIKTLIRAYDPCIACATH
jgi:coenzyme F420-reducing hydrogenase alpha subunit